MQPPSSHAFPHSTPSSSLSSSTSTSTAFSYRTSTAPQHQHHHPLPSLNVQITMAQRPHPPLLAGVRYAPMTSSLPPAMTIMRPPPLVPPTMWQRRQSEDDETMPEVGPAAANNYSHTSEPPPTTTTDPDDLLPSRSPAHSESSSCSSSSTLVEFGPASEPSPREAVDVKKKRPRFLGDIDRRMIIQRLQNGEKQADLAREFGVTRAAICHINKNREEILTRFDILAKSPQGRQMIENYVRSPLLSSAISSTLCEVRTSSVAVLLTRLRNPLTSTIIFRSTARRLMSILLEEALVSFGTKPVTVPLSEPGQNFEGRDYAQNMCAVASGEEGMPLLEVFAEMEPAAATGYIPTHPNLETESEHTKLASVPNDIRSRRVLLTQVCADDRASRHLKAAIQLLKSHGAAEENISIVTLSISNDVVNAVSSEYPATRMVTASVGSSSPNQEDEHCICNKLFLVRYREGAPK